MKASSDTAQAVKSAIETIYHQNRTLINENEDLRARLAVAEPVYLKQLARQEGRRLTRQLRLQISDLAQRAVLLNSAHERGHLVARPNWLELGALCQHTIALEKRLTHLAGQLKATGSPDAQTDDVAMDASLSQDETPIPIPNPSPTPTPTPTPAEEIESAPVAPASTTTLSAECTGQGKPASGITGLSAREDLLDPEDPPASEEHTLIAAIYNEFMSPSLLGDLPVDLEAMDALATFLPLTAGNETGGLLPEGVATTRAAGTGGRLAPVDRRDRRQQERLERRQARRQGRPRPNRSSP